nr:MAG TPA: hypothetical protein [Caudoviricetes sp.]
MKDFKNSVNLIESYQFMPFFVDFTLYLLHISDR